MSITITWSTPDHRYFMRRSKSEIITRIGELRGYPITTDQYNVMKNWTKDALASEAMRLVRALPPPPDPVEQMASIIAAELRRQAEENGPTPYYHLEPKWVALLDGHFNLRQLAQAVLKSGIITP